MRRPPERFPRSARLNEVILEVLADELERLSDPRLELVTLTGVDTTRDLAQATVYYSSLGGGPEAPVGSDEDAAAALQSAAPHLRAVLGRSIRVRNVPKLVFRVDPGIERGQRIDAILRDIHEREARSGEGE